MSMDMMISYHAFKTFTLHGHGFDYTAHDLIPPVAQTASNITTSKSSSN